MNCLLILLLLTCNNSTNVCHTHRNTDCGCRINREPIRRDVERCIPAEDRREVERCIPCDSPWNIYQNTRETCKCEEKPVV